MLNTYNNPYFKRLQRVVGIYARSKKVRVKKKLRKRIKFEASKLVEYGKRERAKSGQAY